MILQTGMDEFDYDEAIAAINNETPTPEEAIPIHLFNPCGGLQLLGPFGGEETEDTSGRALAMNYAFKEPVGSEEHDQFTLWTSNVASESFSLKEFPVKCQVSFLTYPCFSFFEGEGKWEVGYFKVDYNG